jgi:elongation factor Ts
MANFTLEDVKNLRERLGTGMVDTKNALVEAEGDMEKAVEILRLKGAKGNAKRADRSTAEGLVGAVDNGDGTATIIELACETDFVAKGDKFVASPSACSRPWPRPAPRPSRPPWPLRPRARPSPT